MTGGERVRQTLEAILRGWDSLPVRVHQDGQWQTLLLSEIRDDRIVAEHVVRFLVSRHLPDPPEGLAGRPTTGPLPRGT